MFTVPCIGKWLIVIGSVGLALPSYKINSHDNTDAIDVVIPPIIRSNNMSRVVHMQLQNFISSSYSSSSRCCFLFLDDVFDVVFVFVFVFFVFFVLSRTMVFRGCTHCRGFH